MTNPDVRFAQVFRDGDIPAGTRLSITLPDGTPVSYTAARVNTWPDGSLRIADLLAEIPTTIAPGGILPLIIAAQGGAFDTTLPNGKSVTAIVADITANHDPIGIELDGLTNSAGQTVGSGTWVADSTTAFSSLPGSDGGFRRVATGPTASDFVAWMRLRDQNSNATNPNLWAQFYVTAFLNPTTGSVDKLSWRAWLNQGIMNVANDAYTYHLKLKLGGTDVRTWGFAGDGRDLSFAPSAVNTASAQITLPNHGFNSGEMVRFASTGTLPGGLSAGSNYWVHRIDANTIGVYPNQLSAGSWGSPVTLTSQGSGTLHITGYVQHLRFQRHAMAGADGQFDWSAGHTGALLSNPTAAIIHDSPYYQQSHMAPPIDLSVNMTSATQANPQRWAPGTNGAFDVSYNWSFAKWSQLA